MMNNKPKDVLGITTWGRPEEIMHTSYGTRRFDEWLVEEQNRLAAAKIVTIVKPNSKGEVSLWRVI